MSSSWQNDLTNQQLHSLGNRAFRCQFVMHKGEVQRCEDYVDEKSEYAPILDQGHHGAREGEHSSPWKPSKHLMLFACRSKLPSHLPSTHRASGMQGSHRAFESVDALCALMGVLFNIICTLPVHGSPVQGA